jgi:NAD-dependent deacetylase
VQIQGPVVFFTGAGISVGAGLPTYRGTGGLYESGNLEPPHAHDVTPQRLPALWDRFRPRLTLFDELGPAPAHMAIAELEQRLAVTVVTQNVDGLHTLAGSSHVIELHGTLRTLRCLDNSHVHSVHEAPWPAGEAPQCPTCGGPCRPNVVLFGEALPSGAFIEAEAVMSQAQTIVAVGTSALVYPAAFLIDAQLVGSANCVWVNPETPPPDGTWRWLRGSADEQLARLIPS